ASKPNAKPKPKPKLSNEERRAQLLETYDLDKDGKLSDEERAASKAKPAPEKPKAEPDAEPDAKPDAKPEKKGTPEPKPKRTGAERQQRLLDRYDTDKDGKLNEEEHAVYLEDQAERPKKSRGKGKGKGN
ncbi:MAG: Ca2+-binding EF-hand superfamily protein, partial [Planctomycetota bacterium]